MIKLEKSFIKFLLVGLTNTAISYIVLMIGLYAFSTLALKATLAQAISYGVGMLWSFFLNKRWTFNSNYSSTNEFKKFISLQFFFAFISSATLGIFVDYYAFNPTVVWLIVMGFITIANYWTSKNWVFNNG